MSRADRAAVVVLAPAAWLLYGLARLVPPASLSGSLEPVGTAAAIAGLVAGPMLTVVALVAVAVAIRRRERLEVALAALTTLGAVAVLAPRPTSAASPGGALTVMSWNVGRLGGIHERDGKAAADEAKARTTACLANQIAILAPDVLVLTEVSRYDVESILEPALGSLGQKCVHTAHNAGKQLSAGTLVCAWSGLLRMQDHDIVQVPQAGLDDQQFPLVRMAGKGGRLEVAGLHLPPIHRAPERWPAWSRAGVAAVAQQDMLQTARAARSGDWPSVLAGDFNQSRHAWIHADLRTDYADVYETSRKSLGGTRLMGPWAVARIDYVYADRERLDAVDARVVRVGCADHDPVLARVRQK